MPDHGSVLLPGQWAGAGPLSDVETGGDKLDKMELDSRICVLASSIVVVLKSFSASATRAFNSRAQLFLFLQGCQRFSVSIVDLPYA